ncbi:cytochrome P450 [Trichoderma pleuroticola]
MIIRHGKFGPYCNPEVVDYIGTEPLFQGQSGAIDISKCLAEITIFTAARALQGHEPIDFLMLWAPLPQNLKRDAAHATRRATYMDIIKSCRKSGLKEVSDMIWYLMNCTYKSGTPVPDREIAHMMITLLMAGQHTSSSAGPWTILRLALHPDIAEQQYEEQLSQLGCAGRLAPLQYSDLNELQLLRNVRPIKVVRTGYVITPDKVLLASPLVTALSDDSSLMLQEIDENARTDMEEPFISKETRSLYLPFSASRHRCIGEKFAYVNLSVIVVTMVRCFRFYLPDKGKAVPKTDHSSRNADVK